MVDQDAVAASPFGNLVVDSLVGDGIVINPRPACVKLIVRGSGSAEFSDSVENALGLKPPMTPNTVTRHSDLNNTGALFWLGPDEWLFRADSSACAEPLIRRVRDALADQHSAVVDVSDYHAVIGLAGPRSFSVLSKGTPLDCVTALGDKTRCAQTRFGHASVLLDRVADSGDGPAVDLQVRWSFVESVWQQLALAILEYQ